MALSDWDTAAWDWDGKPCDGRLAHPKNGAAVRIYKNWVYIESEQEWRQAFSFVRPTIAQLNSGDLQISGLSVTAVRGPQNSVFVLVQYGESVGKNKYARHTAGGIGASGYLSLVPGILRRARVPKSEWGEWHECTECGDGKTTRYLDHLDEKKGYKPMFRRIKIKGPSYRYVGVMKSTVRAFVKWAAKEIGEYDPEGQAWLKKVAKNCLRFNQGDAYFAGALRRRVPATRPGKPAPTVLSRLLK